MRPAPPPVGTPPHRSVRVTMAAVLGALVLVVALSVAVSLREIRAQDTHALVINLAGRQRMLTERVAKEAWASLARSRSTAALDRVHTQAHQAGTALRAIEDGGEIPYAGRIVSVPATEDPATRTLLVEAGELWEEFHASVHAVMTAESAGPDLVQELVTLDRRTEELVEELEATVRGFQAVAEADMGRLRRIQAGFLLAALIVLGIGMRLVLTRVVRPVEVLEEAARRIEAGDLDRRVEVDVRNELGGLARTFDRTRAGVRARIEEQAALLRFSYALFGATDFKDVLDVTARTVKEAHEADYVSIMVPDESGRALELVAGAGWEPEMYGRYRLEIDDSREGHVFRTDQPVGQPDVQSGVSFPCPAALVERGVVSSFTAPMRGTGEALGTLCVHFTRRRELEPEEVSLLSLIANQAAVAVERAQVSRAAREAETRYRELFDRLPIGAYRTTLDGRLLDANLAMARMLGYPDTASLLAVNATDLYEDPHGRERWQAVVDESGLVRGLEVWMRAYDGGSLCVEETSRTVLDEQGNPIGYEGTLQDVTSRVGARDLLQASERRFRTLVEAAPYAMVVTDGDHRIMDMNAAAEEIFRYERGDVMGQEIEILLPETGRAAHRAKTESSSDSSLRRPMEPGREILGRRSDGSLFPMDAILSSVEGLDAGGGSHVIAAIRDLTDRKELEARLAQAQKMEAVGRLAGGVAHDFNNLLTVIGGQVELLMEGVRDPELRGGLDEVRDAVRKAAAVTDQLLAFSRKKIRRPRVLDLHRLVTDLGGMLQRVIGEDIELHTVLDPELGRVKADHTQMEQVVMNLVVNARDAMPQGGELIVEAANVELDQDFLRQHVGAQQGPHVMLAVTDTGTGMDAETQAHIFEPFYTTKEAGRGTGLGLATTYGCVKQSGGSIWVDSTPGEGTVFRVYLPRTEEEEPRETPVHPPDAERGGVQGSETVLLVEDEDAVRSVARRILERFGYTVLEAQDAEAAVEVFERDQGAVDLLLTDVVLPGRRGPELCAQLRRVAPGLKVLYVSGYAEDEVSREAELETGMAFLGKPFSMPDLVRAVRDVLDSV